MNSVEPAGMEMTDILGTKATEKLAAVLTSAGISHSTEVESIKTIVEFWKEVSTIVTIETEQDYITAVLTFGRILDIEDEFFEPKKILPIFKGLQEKVNGAWEVGEEGVQPIDIAAAFLTAAVISQTEAVETTGSIVQLWKSLCKFLKITDMYDFIAGLLAMGRIMEEKTQIQTANEINMIVHGLRKEIDESNVPMTADVELAWALLTSAHIEVSETVEKFRDIISTWKNLRDTIVLLDDEDIISCILATGRIRDIDIHQINGLQNAWTIVEKIKAEVMNT